MGEELVRVTTVGLCGSDRHWFVQGSVGDAVVSRPLVLGHEISGVIASGPRRGERVAVDPADPCGRCDQCTAGLAHLCRDLRFLGHGTTDGGLRTLMPWPGRLLMPIPEHIDNDAAALLEPLGVALHAIDLAKIRRGTTAGVFGCGPIGLLLIQVLRQKGAAFVLATDPLDHRRDAAALAGADDVRRPVAGNAGHVSDPPAWPAMDVAFEVAGTDGALDDAMTAVKPGARVVLVGIPDSDATTFRASTARHKGLSLLLSRRMVGSDLARAAALAETGQVDLGSLITARYPLERTADAFTSLARRDGLKVVIEASN